MKTGSIKGKYDEEILGFVDGEGRHRESVMPKMERKLKYISWQTQAEIMKKGREIG